AELGRRVPRCGCSVCASNSLERGRWRCSVTHGPFRKAPPRIANRPGRSTGESSAGRSAAGGATGALGRIHRRGRRAVAGDASAATIERPNRTGNRRQMVRNTSTTWRRSGLLGMVAFVLAATTGCHEDRVDTVRRLVPALDPELAAHIVRDDSIALRDFVRHTDVNRLAEARFHLRFRLMLPSFEEFAAADSVLGPYLDRTTRVLASETDDPAFWTTHLAFRRRPPHEQFEILRLLKKPSEIETAADVPDSSRLRLYEDVLEASRPYSDAMDLGAAY